MKKVIAITGGIASGKSIFSNYIRKKGYKVLDADAITHSMYDKGIFNDSLVKAFGNAIIKNGSIDRAYLAEIIYNDMSKKKILDSIMHPLIYNEMKRLIDESIEDIVFIDVALLFEAGFDKLADTIICIIADENIRAQRLSQRDNISIEYALKKIRSQITDNERIERSDYVIEHNDNSFDDYYKKIDKVLQEVI